MAEQFKLQIGSDIFEVNEPTFEQLNDLKEELGFDITGGLPKEQEAKLYSDMKLVARGVAIIALRTGTAYSKETLDANADYIYKYGKISTMKQVFSFFGRALQGESATGSEAGTPSEAPKKEAKKK